MKRFSRLLMGLSVLAGLGTMQSATPVFGAAFTAGNLAIYRTGDGTIDLINTGAKVFIDEYTPAGVLVQSIELPSAAAVGPNLVASGTATSEGLISRSPDGTKLVITGYNSTIPAAASLTASAAATTNRVVGILDSTGTPALYGFSDVGNTNNVRTGVLSGTSLYVAGGNGGVRYADLSTLVAGSTNNTSTQLTTLNNIRQIDIFNGQLYASNDSTSGGNTVILGSVGTGLPTATGQTYDTLPGFINHTANAASTAYGFFFADLDATVTGLDTLYLADDGAAALTKYSLAAGNWTATGTIGVDTDDYRSVTGTVSGSTVTLYATRKGGSSVTGGGELVSIVDASGYNGMLTATPTVLATATTKTAFRGIDFVPSSGVTPPTNNADFNNDLVVDGLDFLIWQQGNGLTGVPTNDKSTGDANGDHAVNDLDLGIWKAKFGGAPAIGAVGAVPEPASLSLGLAAIFGLAGLRRRAKNL